MLELQRQQADAKIKQERAVLTIQARKEAETKKIQEEERKKAGSTTIMVDENLAV